MANIKGKLALAFDLGGTKLACAVVDASGKVIEEVRILTPFERGVSGVVDAMIEIGRPLLAKYADKYDIVQKIGLASAGPLDPVRGILLNPTNFPGDWKSFPLAARLSSGLNHYPVILENDAAASVMAEHWAGVAKDTGNVMTLTLGTGLGTGIMIDGKLLRGGHSLHTEAGHIIINWDDPNTSCGCGNRGCAESYLSGRAFERMFKERTGQSHSPRQIAELAKSGDKDAIALFHEYGEILAVAITTFVSLFSPELFVLTGSFAEAHPFFLPDTRRHLESRLKKRREGIDLFPEIRISSLHNDAGLIGAAYLVFNSTA